MVAGASNWRQLTNADDSKYFPQKSQKKQDLSVRYEDRQMLRIII